MRRSSIVGTAVLIGLGILGLLFWIYRDAAPANALRDAAPASSATRARVGSGSPVQISSHPAAGSSANLRTAPLPPHNARLADIYAELRERADANEPKAACRLAFELDRCSRLPALRAGAKFFADRVAQRQADGKADPAAADMAIRLKKRESEATTACAGFSTPPSRPAWDYALVAAQQGSGAAVMNFVGVKIGLDQLNPANTAQGWVAYKELAPGLLQRAMEAGDPEAYQYVAEVTTQQNELGGRVLPFDPVKGIAIYKALRLYATDDFRKKLDDEISGRIEMLRLTPDQIAQTDAEAAKYSPSLSASSQAPITGVPNEDRASYCDKN